MNETIRTVMTTEPWCITESAPLSLAAATLVQRRIRHLPVIGGPMQDGGRLVGLVDDSVIFARGQLLDGIWKPYDSRDEHLIVGDVSYDARIVMEATDPLLALLQKMALGGTDCAVIVDRARHPVGIVTAHDLVRVSMRLLPNLAVRDIMSSPALSVDANQPVGAAFDTMAAHRCRHLLVLDRQTPFAIVSWRDLVERGWDRRLSITLREVAPQSMLETVDVSAHLAEVAERMVTQKVGCLPVVGTSREIVGLVSRTDIIAQMARAYRP